MKKFLLRAVKIVSLLLALVICIGLLQEYVLCHADHNRERIKGFYLEDDNSLDVAVIGASDVYAGYSAGYAYEKYGFTSYPIATQSNIMKCYKTQIKEILKHQNPKLIVVELNGALYGDDRDINKEANFRNYVDNIPMSANKVELIQSIATSNELEYYVPIIKYHSVWKDFPQGLAWSYTMINDRFRGYNYLKGVKNKTVEFKPKKKVYNATLKDDDKKVPLTEKSEEYLREFLDYCKSEGIDNILFVRFPHIVTKGMLARYHKANMLADIIGEYGYDYINFEKDFEKTGLDVNHDFYNYDHLNAYGQKTFTDYLCNILVDKYNIGKSELTDSQKKEWDEAARYYEAYYQYNDECIKNKDYRNLSEYFRNIEAMQKYLDD